MFKYILKTPNAFIHVDEVGLREFIENFKPNDGSEVEIYSYFTTLPNPNLVLQENQGTSDKISKASYSDEVILGV